MKSVFAIFAALFITAIVGASVSANAATSSAKLSKAESLKAVAKGLVWAANHPSELPDTKKDPATGEVSEMLSGYSSLQILTTLNLKLTSVKRMGITVSKQSEKGVECLKTANVISCKSIEFFKVEGPDGEEGSLEEYSIELKSEVNAYGEEELIVTKTEAIMAG